MQINIIQTNKIQTNRISGIKILIAVIFTAAGLLTGCEKADTIDYGDAASWAVCETDAELSAEKAADVFFVCPTAVHGEDQSLNMDIADQESRDRFLSATLMEKGIYDDNARFFAPYYRQAALEVYELPAEGRSDYLSYAYNDVKAAFEFYLKEYNNDRPLILAGFSQGGDMVKRLMVEYGDSRDFNSKLVGAYVISWNITDEDLEAWPYLRMAQGESDTAVIVSFCSESEDTDTTISVPTATHSINPLSWMTDEAPADKALNLGACFMDKTGEITSEIPEFTGAYIDPQRGTLKLTDVNKEEYPAKLSFTKDGDYHIYDYVFFYRNLEKNVQTRIRQYEALNSIKAGGFRQNKYADISEKIPGDWSEIGATAEVGTAVDAGAPIAGDPDALVENPGTAASPGTATAPGAMAASQPVFLAKTVTDEMCSPDYWLKKRTNPDQVILDADGVADFNSAQLPKHPNHHSYYHYVGEGRAAKLSGDELKELLEVFSFSPERGWFYADGAPVEGEFYDELNRLRNIDSVEPVNEIRYGVALKSSGVRIGPSDIAISAGEEYDYCDELQNSSVRMNEPLIILWESSDGLWYYVATHYCLGWIKKEDVGVTGDYDYWEKAIDPKDFLIVTGNHMRFDQDPSNERISARGIDMGTKLALVTDGSFDKNNYDRHALNNYSVKLPCRDAEGNLIYEYAYLPQSIDVNIGYLDFTQRNIITLAFKCLGEQYGWAGLFDNRDCSQYLMEAYKCFGIDLPRTTSGMKGIPWTGLDTTNLSDEEKMEMLDVMPIGSLLIFPGHVMMYLGEEKGEYYCISSLGTVKLEKGGELVRARSVAINSLCSTWRGNDNTWLNSITHIKIPYRTEGRFYCPGQ